MQRFETKDDQGRIVLPKDIDPLIYKIKNGDVFNFYFIHKGKRFYFKSNSIYTLDVTELLAQAFADEIGIPCVKYMPVVLEYAGYTFYGVISEDFIKNRKTTEILNGKDMLEMYEKPEVFGMKKCNTVEHHINALKSLKETIESEEEAKYKVVLDPSIPLGLKKRILNADIIADQDCHAHNIEYLIKTDKNNVKTIKLAPAFDNSMSFLLKNFRNNDLSIYFNRKGAIEKRLEIEDKLDSTLLPFQVKSTSNGKTSRPFLSMEIAEMVRDDKNLLDMFKKIKSTNFHKLFTEFRNKNNFSFISDEQIEIASLVVESSTKALEASMLAVKLRDENKHLNILKPKEQINFEL